MFTEQNQADFKKQLAVGEEGEEEVANFLIEKCNFAVLPLYQFISKKTPGIFYNSYNFICPDLTCFRDGKVIFVDAKRKSRWVNFTGKLETGFNLNHFREYKKLQEKVNIPVFIVFNHHDKEPTGLFFTYIDNYSRIWDGTYNGSQKFQPLVFYNYKDLKSLEKIT